MAAEGAATILQSGEGAVVFIGAGPKPVAGDVPTLDNKAQAHLQEKFNNLTNIVCKIGDSWKPWSASKNRIRAAAAVAQLEGEKHALLKVLDQQLNHANALKAETLAARKELQKYNDVVAKTVALEATIQQLHGEIADLKEAKAAKMSQVAELLQKVEEVAPGPKRYLKLDEKKEAEVLQRRVEALLVEHERLRTENDKLTKRCAELTRKNKDLADKARDEAEIREREVKRYMGELRKAVEGREADVAAAKAEQADALERAKKDAKGAQKRLETARAELETARGREKTLKTQLDEANTALAKAQEEAKGAKIKAADARAAREDAGREVEAAKREAESVQDEYRLALQALSELPGGLSKLPAARFFATGEHAAPWPRRAFTVRGGKLLHSKACGAMDVSRVEPREYRNHRELEAWVVGEGLALCPHCAQDGF